MKFVDTNTKSRVTYMGVDSALFKVGILKGSCYWVSVIL